MTTLRTHNRGIDQDADIVPVLRTRWRKPKLAPGVFVEDAKALQGKRGLGMVVAVAADEIAVLWSVEPVPRRSLERNPLAVDEDYCLRTFSYVVDILERMVGLKQ